MVIISWLSSLHSEAVTEPYSEPEMQPAKENKCHVWGQTHCYEWILLNIQKSF